MKDAPKDEFFWIFREEVVLADASCFYPKPPKIIDSSSSLFSTIKSVNQKGEKLLIQGFEYQVSFNEEEEILEFTSDSIMLIYCKFQKENNYISKGDLNLEESMWKIKNTNKELFFTSRKYLNVEESINNLKIVEFNSPDNLIYGMWHIEEYGSIKFLVLRKGSYGVDSYFLILEHGLDRLKLSFWNKNKRIEQIVECTPLPRPLQKKNKK
ncbi:MAG TPA: hypothetical protein ENK52_05890 [Saprospiraceae bacterium]|nr:hypothetical protein [Saprospiraceae bacterium]